MKKITHKKWQLAVREARQYIQNYDKVRFKIVEIALSVCDISRGGRKDGEFTLSKFALAIDLIPKTLHGWVAVKRNVVDKLPSTYRQKISTYFYEDLRAVACSVDSSSSPKEVLLRFKEQLAQPPEIKKFVKYNKHLNSILYNAQRPMNLLNIDGGLLTEIMQKCSAIAGLVSTELALREKFSTEERLTKEKNRIDKAIAYAKNPPQIETKTK